MIRHQIHHRATDLRSNGFTLVEILVAIVIFAIVGVLAMGGFNQLLGQSEHTRANMQRVRALQKTVYRITQDFAELEPRPIRDTLGNTVQPCLLADGSSQFIVQLTHSGWSNPAGIQRSTLQRVAYRLDKDKLIREYWPVLDRIGSTEPISVVMIDRVDSLKLRFMDEQQNWHDYWPENSGATRGPVTGNGVPTTPPPIINNPPNATNNAASVLSAEQRPLAIEMTLELQDWGKIIRLVEVPG